MKTVVDIIYRDPKPSEPSKPTIFSLVIAAAVIYLIYLFDKGLQLSNVDFLLIPAFILAIGLKVYFYSRKK